MYFNFAIIISVIILFIIWYVYTGPETKDNYGNYEEYFSSKAEKAAAITNWVSHNEPTYNSYKKAIGPDIVEYSQVNKLYKSSDGKVTIDEIKSIL